MFFALEKLTVSTAVTPRGQSMYQNNIFVLLSSDESESTCWSTSDGRCYIPQHSRCDGRIDCRGSWDERNC